MKIAHLISNYFPKVGGAQVCIHHVADGIIKKGEEAVVITPTRKGNTIFKDDTIFKYEILRSKRLLFLNRFLYLNSISFSLGKPRLEPILDKIQKKYNFDIWQVTVGYPLGAAAADFFNKNKIPCILRCTGEDLQRKEEFKFKYGRRLNKKIDKQIEENYKKFTAFVALSESVKKDYLSLNIPEDKIHIIPNGVDCARFNMPIDREKVRSELGVGNNQKLIVTVGRRHPKKGFEHIPKIIKKLVKKFNNFKWLLIGKGNKSIKLLAEKKGVGEYLIVKEINPRKSNTGEPEVPSSKLIQYYKASDIFVFPTIIETFGMVLVEAMAAGLPIVTTDAPGPSDIIRDGENGLINESRDVDGLAESIFKVLSNKELAGKLGENALKDAKNYDWQRVVDKYFQLYKNVIDYK